MSGSNDKLFLLISKLTSSEKGYVNKHLKLSNPNSNLLQLYTLIGRVKPSQDADLRKKLSPVLLKNLAVTKKQLFNRILKILRDYYANKGKLRHVLTMLEDIMFLFDKGMVVECEKILKKALNICDEYEFHALKLHLLEWEKRILNAYYYDKPLQEKIVGLRKTTQKTIVQFNLVNDLELNKLQLISDCVNDRQNLLEKIKAKGDMFTAPLTQPFSDSKDFQNSNRLIITTSGMLGIINRLRGYSNEAAYAMLKSIPETSPKLNPLSLENYQEVLVRKIGLCTLINDLENFEVHINQLDQLHDRYPLPYNHSHTGMFALTYELQYRRSLGAPYEAEKAAKLDHFLDKFAEKIPQGTWFCYTLAQYYFFYGKYELAYSLNLKALSQPKSYSGKYEYVCRFFEIMILLELERFNRIERTIQEIKRYLKKGEGLRPFDKNIIAFFRLVESNWGRMSKCDLMAEFEKKFPNYKSKENFELVYLNIPTWLKAKSKRITMDEYRRLCKD